MHTLGSRCNDFSGLLTCHAWHAACSTAEVPLTEPMPLHEETPEATTSASIEVSQDVDVFMSRAKARELALRAGFERGEAENLALVVTELATGLIQRSRRGSIRLSLVRDGDLGPGLLVVATDHGPPSSGSPDSVRRHGHVVRYEYRNGENVLSVTRYVCAPRRGTT